MSILLDGTTGITTPGLTNTGTETIVNLTTTGNTILGDATTDTLNVGAGGLVKDASGNVGIGVTPSAWNSGYKALQVGSGGSLLQQTSGYNNTNLASNTYLDTSGNFIYLGTDYSTRYSQYQGMHRWFTAPSGTAGTAISFTQAMTLDASGNLGIGTSSPSGRLHINSSGAAIAYIQSTLVAGNTNVETRYISTNRTWGVGQNIIQTSSVFEIADVTASATRLAIDSSGNVGIGTASPASYGVARKALTINGTDGGLIDLQANGTRVGSFVSQVDAMDIYAITAVPLRFFTNSSERMRIDSSGNVGIGTTPGYKLDVSGNNGIRVTNTGTIIVGAQSSYAAGFGNGNADLTLGTDGSYAYIQSWASKPLVLNNAGNGIRANGDYFYVDKGVQFPATQYASSNANTLDDYEEGTFTPQFSFAGGQTGITYGNQTGRYTKVGRVVTIQCYCLFSNKGSSTGQLRLQNLPFANTSASAAYCCASVWMNSFTGLSGAQQAFMGAGDTYLAFFYGGTGVSFSITNTNTANNSDVMVNISYITD